MKAETVEMVYQALKVRGLIVQRPIYSPEFEGIAHALSTGDPMSLDDAIENLKAAVPDSRLSIKLEVNFSAKSGNVTIEYQTWNGHEHFRGSSLKAAVELLLVSEGKLTGSVDEADRILADAMDYQEQRL